MNNLWLFLALLGWVWLAIALWRITVTQDEVLAKLASLKAKVEALIARPATVADLTPVGEAVDAIAAEVEAANPPPA